MKRFHNYDHLKPKNNRFSSLIVDLTNGMQIAMRGSWLDNNVQVVIQDLFMRIFAVKFLPLR